MQKKGVQIMGLLDLLGDIAGSLIAQGQKEQARRERQRHRANREIVNMYNDANDGGSDYRSIAKKNIGSNHGWYTCPHCGRKFRASQMDVDHIVPQSLGGENSRYNLQYLCPHCNRSKGNRTDDTEKDLQRRKRELRQRDREDTEFLDRLSRK